MEKSEKTAMKNDLVKVFFPIRGGLTRAGNSFQKHSARGQFTRTSNSQSTFDAQGQNLLNTITSSPAVQISLTQNSGYVRVTAPGVGSAHFYRNGTFHSFSQFGQ